MCILYCILKTLKHIINKSLLFSGIKPVSPTYQGDAYISYNQGDDDTYEEVVYPTNLVTKYIGDYHAFRKDRGRCFGLNIFSCCCQKSFSIEKGQPGFVGHASASIAAMEVYHLYRVYREIIKYQSNLQPYIPYKHFQR